MTPQTPTPTPRERIAQIADEVQLRGEKCASGKVLILDRLNLEQAIERGLEASLAAEQAPQPPEVQKVREDKAGFVSYDGISTTDERVHLYGWRQNGVQVGLGYIRRDGNQIIHELERAASLSPSSPQDRGLAEPLKILRDDLRKAAEKPDFFIGQKHLLRSWADEVDRRMRRLSAVTPSSSQGCPTCHGRRWVMRSETRDLGNGIGAGGSWNEPCPDCCPPAPGAGRPPQEKP